MFKHLDLELSPDLKTKNKDGNRYYVTPSGELYPSVTTITSQLTKEGIKAWRKRVGEKEANKISTQASRRGTKVHKLCEDFLNNELSFDDYTPDNVGPKKPDQGFNDRLKDIKRSHRGSNINIYD